MKKITFFVKTTFIWAILTLASLQSIWGKVGYSINISPIDNLKISPNSVVLSSDYPLVDSVSTKQFVNTKDSLDDQVVVTTNDTPLLKGVMYKFPNQLFSIFSNLSRPQKSLIYNIIPGGGPLYNKKYWKIPLVLTLATGCTYAIVRFSGQYNEYHVAYRDFMSPDPLQYDSWKGFVPPGKDPTQFVGDTNLKSRLKKGNDYYRRYRDLSILLSFVVYLLSFVDTYVDAQLADFDISPNLSMLSSSINLEKLADWKIPTVGVAISF